MKWQRRWSGKQRSRTTRVLHAPRLECLEERQVLAANVLADFQATVTSGTNTELEIKVTIPDSVAGTTANLSMVSMAAEGSSLDPTAISVQDADGNLLMPISAIDNAAGTSSGHSVVELTAGDYTLILAGEGTTSGTAQVQISLLGDTLADAGQVSRSEEVVASAALLQGSGGGNFVTEMFYQSLGIDLGVDQFDSGMDVDGDGVLSASEFSLIQANHGIGNVTVEFTGTGQTNETLNATLQNDTGTSDSDRITTDPTITGAVSDETEIVSMTATINGGAAFDLTTLFDPNDASSFTLTRSQLDQVAGGSLDAGEVQLSLSVTDDLGNSRTYDGLEFVFIETNTAPTTTGIADQTAAKDTLFSLDVRTTFSDSNTGDVLVFSVGSLPSWLSFDAATSTLSGTPTDSDAGSSSILVTATDSQGAAVSDTFTLNVPSVNRPPVLSLTNQTVNENSPVLIDLNNSVSDPDTGDTVTISVSGLPNWLQNNNGVLTGSPGNSDVGTSTLEVTATDAAGATDTETFTITVVDVNVAPNLVGQIPDQTLDQGQAFSVDFDGFFQDADGDDLTISVALTDGGALPSWLSFNSATNVLSGAPGSDDLGRISVRVTATDPGGASASDDFLIDVGDTNDPPVATQISDAAAMEGQAFTLDVSGNFSDPDPGDVLTLSAELADESDLPGWLSFAAATGVFSGTPTNDDVGTLSVNVTATDTAGLSASSSFTLTIADVNAAPIVSNPISDQTVDPDASFSLDVSETFSDEDPNDTLSLTVSDLPNWLSFTPSTNTFSGTPGSDDAGTTTIVVTATDQASATATDSFDLTVNASSNAAPMANDDSGFTTADSDLLTIEIADLLSNDTDSDGDTLSISTVNATSERGATVQLVGSTLRYDPSSAAELLEMHNGEEVVDRFQYTVSDGELTDTAEVSITVEGVDVAAFTLKTTDADGNVLTQVSTGGTFFLQGFVQDLRDAADGIFSAYLDVEYPATAATPVGSIVHGSTYGSATSGSTATPGLIDEVGGIDGLTPIGGDVHEVFRLEFTAGATPSSVTFSTNPAEDLTQHPVLTFNSTANLDPAQILFGSATINVVAPGAALSTVGTLHEPLNVNPSEDLVEPLDVNADGHVSPLDALMVANELNGYGESNDRLDVNSDGIVSPIDMLLIVNAINDHQSAVGPVSEAAPLPAAPLSAGPTAKTSDQVFAALGKLESEGGRLAGTSLVPLSSELSSDRGEEVDSVFADSSIREDIELL